MKGGDVPLTTEKQNSLNPLRRFCRKQPRRDTAAKKVMIMNNNNATWLNDNDLFDNPSARVPVCLCLDVSGSMGGAPIRELNAGVQQFITAVREDEAALYSAEIGIVTFDDTVNKVADFTRAEQGLHVPVFTTGNMTYMGEAVNTCLDMLESRKKEYSRAGVDYYQPWLVLMTDGYPNGKPAELERAIRRAKDLAGAHKLTVIPIAIGDDADRRTLGRFAADGKSLKLNGLRFREFFTWLSRSVSAVSQSMPGDTFNFGPTESWESL